MHTQHSILEQAEKITLPPRILFLHGVPRGG